MSTVDTQTMRKVGTMQTVCVTCGQDATFNYMGEQVWPERVAMAMQVKPEVELWQCGHCHTTLTVSQPLSAD